MQTSQCNRFVLLCHQRSGSNALDSLLRQHPQIGIYGQLFNNSLEYRRYNRHDLDMPLFQPHPRTAHHFGTKLSARRRLELFALKFMRRERDLARFMARFWQQFSDPKWQAAGFKLHDFQVTDEQLTALVTQHVDKVIVLARRNLLKAAVSWGVAVQTDAWVRTSDGGKQPSVRLDINELAWFIEKTRREVAKWQQIAHNVPHLFLEYETDVATKRIASLLAFLEVDGDFSADFQTKRLATPTYQHITNAREINDQLGSAKNGFLFEPS